MTRIFGKIVFKIFWSQNFVEIFSRASKTNQNHNIYSAFTADVLKEFEKKIQKKKNSKK